MFRWMRAMPYKSGAAVGAAAVVLGWTAVVVAAGDTTRTVDAGGYVGLYSSLQLDGSGYPVISYYDAFNADLRLVHCNDLACDGGDETIRTVDATGNVGAYGSLQLDASGFPVVSYWDQTNGDVKLVHCNDPACDGADETIRTVDATGNVGRSTSLQLDVRGFPVISYDDYTFAVGSDGVVPPGAVGPLKVAHCNDAACDGGDETIRSVDSTGIVATESSLQLDRSGFPVISYLDSTNYDLKVAHCNDAACDGGDETIRTVDTAGEFVGLSSSLQLDESGFPVVSYHAGCVGGCHLRVAHCNDAACDGGDETIRSVDSTGNTGHYISLQLNSSGFPVISYVELSQGLLKVVQCNDPSCEGQDETMRTLDDGQGWGTSLQLDGSGFPVISYHDTIDGDLKLVRCDDPGCLTDNDGDGVLDVADNCANVANPDQLDTDADTTGNACDDDDDADGQLDAHELTCGSNPLDATSTSVDSDKDTIPDCVVSAPVPPAAVATTVVPARTLPATGTGITMAALVGAFVFLAVGLLMTRAALRRGAGLG